MTMNTRDTLLAYGEWLDGQGVGKPIADTDDDRTWDGLAADFISYWEENPNREVLAGRDELDKRFEKALDTLEEMMTKSGVPDGLRVQAAATILSYTVPVQGEDES
jgi:hypothetical protein